MAVRDAMAEDEAAVVTLWRACGLVTDYNDPSADFRFAVRQPNATILVAEIDGVIVGSVMVGHDGHRGWLYYLAAAPGRRRSGIGRAMIAAGERWLRDCGVPKVQLMIRDTNTAVVPFYERLGYEDAPRVVMSKWLD